MSVLQYIKHYCNKNNSRYSPGLALLPTSDFTQLWNSTWESSTSNTWEWWCHLTSHIPCTFRWRLYFAYLKCSELSHFAFTLCSLCSMLWRLAHLLYFTTCSFTDLHEVKGNQTDSSLRFAAVLLYSVQIYALNVMHHWNITFRSISNGKIKSHAGCTT